MEEIDSDDSLMGLCHLRRLFDEKCQPVIPTEIPVIQKHSAITGARTGIDAIKLKLLINIGLFLLHLQQVNDTIGIEIGG